VGDLYQRLVIPLSELNAEVLYSDLHDELEIVYHSYESSYKWECLEGAWEELTRGGVVDFGNLPELHQLDIIKRVRAGELDGIQVQFLDGSTQSAKTWINQTLNKDPFQFSEPVSLGYYSLESYQERFIAQLSKLADRSSAPEQWLDKKRVLKEYLVPERFHFLKG